MNNTTGIIESIIYDSCGYLSGILFATSLIPQIYISCKTKDLNGISLYWLIMFLSALLLLITYSIHNNLKPVYIPALFELFMMLILLLMKLYY